MPVILEGARVGAAVLIVPNLGRSPDFYTGVIGLEVLARIANSAGLGVGADGQVLLELEERPGMQPLTGKRLGLCHLAMLLPSRSALASFADHLSRVGVRAGSSNHVVSEGFYLVDPDGLEVEVYADRDRASWPWCGSELEAAVLPLDLRGLLATPHSRWQGAPSGTTMGHMHFYVDDLQQADRLYRVGLGLNLRTRSIPGALFLAEGDYHHHVGLNTWASRAPVANDNDARLGWWTLNVQSSQLAELRDQMLAAGWMLKREEILADPWGNTVCLQAT